jgi:hypothetical protein
MAKNKPLAISIAAVFIALLIGLSVTIGIALDKEKKENTAQSAQQEENKDTLLPPETIDPAPEDTEKEPEDEENESESNEEDNETIAPHEHNWVPQYRHHDAVAEKGHTVRVPEEGYWSKEEFYMRTWWQTNDNSFVISSDGGGTIEIMDEYIRQHGGGYITWQDKVITNPSKWVVTQPAYTKYVLDTPASPAWGELIGYRCSICGSWRD